MSFTPIIGIAASVFTGVSLLPQLFKIIKDRKAGDISLWMLAVLFAGLTLWVVYGALKNDLIIVTANSFSLLVNVCIVVFTFKYKDRR